MCLRDWFTGALEVTADREEILVVGDLAAVKAAKGAGEAEKAAARESRVDAFREETRAARMRIAEEAQLTRVGVSVTGVVLNDIDFKKESVYDSAYRSYEANRYLTAGSES